MGIESNSVTMIVVHNSLEGSLFCIFKYISLLYTIALVYLYKIITNMSTHTKGLFSYINPYQADFVFNFKAANAKLFNDTVMKNLVRLHSRQMGKWIEEISAFRCTSVKPVWVPARPPPRQTSSTA